MGFKRISRREIILMASAAILLFVAFWASHRHKNNEAFDDQILPAATLPSVIKQTRVMKHIENKSMATDEAVKPLSNLETNDEEVLEKELKEQMDADRHQQRQIKKLRMQLEQANLQLDNEKTVAEINKLKKDDAGYVKDSDPQGGLGFPSMKVIYIGGSEMKKEAILSIAGISYSVKENDKPVGNVEILAIANSSIKVHFSAPQPLTIVINYVQE
jgi:hypothetical protein